MPPATSAVFFSAYSLRVASRRRTKLISPLISPREKNSSAYFVPQLCGNIKYPPRSNSESIEASFGREESGGDEIVQCDRCREERALPSLIAHEAKRSANFQISIKIHRNACYGGQSNGIPYIFRVPSPVSRDWNFLLPATEQRESTETSGDVAARGLERRRVKPKVYRARR